MCKFIGKSNGRILCKLSKSEILRLYTIVHVAMETTKTSHLTCQSKSFISIFFICQVSACERRPFSCHNLANDIYLITDKTVFSHLKRHTSTRNEHFAFLGSCYEEHRVYRSKDSETLSKSNLVASRNIKREKASLLVE